jgi:hypothetical protein
MLSYEVPGISFDEFETYSKKSLSDLEPELRQLFDKFIEILKELEANLLRQDMSEEERRAILRTVVKALECHMRRLPPPNEEVKIWMQMLDPKAFLPKDVGVQ